MKQLGVGLAAAVLIDATLIRGVLLPATMKLLGEANWYLPRILSWLPTFVHEPAAVREHRQPSLETVPDILCLDLRCLSRWTGLEVPMTY